MQFGFLGPDQLGESVQEEFVEAFRPMLPMGFSIKGKNHSGWDPERDRPPYILLLYVIAIIYFICTVLFNSLTRSLIILLIIPVSFIGVFLTFVLFHLKLDQGGYAAFVLLSGITVNASIYMIRQFEYLRIRCPRLPVARCYVKAWRQKIVPISLTVLSTVLGFVPFLVETQVQGFWFPLAAGTIGGLLFSMIGLFLILPLFLIRRKT